MIDRLPILGNYGVTDRKRKALLPLLALSLLTHLKIDTEGFLGTRAI